MRSSKNIKMVGNIIRYALKVISKSLVIMLFLVPAISCIKKETTGEPPAISLMPEIDAIFTDTVIGAGSEMMFSIQASGKDHPLTNFLVRTVSTSTTTVFDTSLHAENLQWKGQFLKGSADDEEWQFIIRDRIGNEDQTSIFIELDTVSAYKPLLSIDDVRLGAQVSAEYNPFFSISGNESYGWEEVNTNEDIQRLVDICYYYGDDLNTIASPGANVETGIFPGEVQSWEIRNTSRYIQTSLTESDFNTMANDSILIALYNESDAKRKAKELSPGDCYVFRIEDGRLGALFINDVTGETTGDVLFDIKIQED
jgi:hypothetical protein